MDENTIVNLTQAVFSITSGLDRLASLVHDLNEKIGGIPYALDNQTISIASSLQGIKNEVHDLKNEVHDLAENSQRMQSDIAEIRDGVDEMR